MKVMHVNEVPAVEIWTDKMKAGTCTCYRLIQPHFCQTMDIAQVVLTPGARTVRFTHDVDWAIHITGGRGTLGNDEEQVELADGVVAYIPAGEPRWIGAAADSALTFMSSHRPKPVTTLLDQ